MKGSNAMKYTIVINGKLGSVRWLEAAPYNAKKVRHGGYFRYQITTDSETMERSLDDRLTESGAWIDNILSVLPSNIAALKAAPAELAAEEMAELAEIDPAFHGFAGYLRSQGIWATQAECLSFCLEQVALAGRKAKSEAVKAELRTIYSAIRTGGGGAYAANKARLQGLAK